MREWPVVRLGDVAELLTGFPFASSRYTDKPGDPRLLRGDNVVQGALRWDGVKRWPTDAMDGVRDYALKEGDVVVAMDRPWIEAGLKYAMVRRGDLPALLVQRVSRMRGRSSLHTPFLRYVIGSRDFTEYVLSVQTGTTVPHISGPQLREFTFPLPPLPVQRAIANILDGLDDKIELSRRMSETLEAMARAVFKSWFVDFDPVRAKAAGRDPGLADEVVDLFPGAFQESEVGELPEGWRVVPIGELASVLGGSTPRTDEPEFWLAGTHHWATPKDLAGLRSPVLLDTSRRVTDAGLAQIGSGLLPRGTVLMSSRAPIGYLAITEVPTAVNQGFIAMVPSPGVSNVFLLNWAREAQGIIISRANGSTFMEISKANFRPIPVVTPAPRVMEAFDALAQPLHARIVSCERESLALAGLRDTLLPKLISGELRVPDAEHIAEEVGA